MKLYKFIFVICFGLFLLPLLFLQGQESQDKSKKAETGQPAGKPKDDLKKVVDGKLPLALLEQLAAKSVSSVKENGVELAIKVKGVPNKESTDIEFAWTLTYTGPRSPLIILQPSLTLTSGATGLIFYAVPKGKDYGVPFHLFGSFEMPGYEGYVQDPYGIQTPVLPVIRFEAGMGNLINLEALRFRTRTKDWWITVPAGKKGEGVITVSGAKMREHFLTFYLDEFDAKEPPRLFVEFVFGPRDRGGDFNFDAWTGDLNVPINAVPALKKW